ncbi:MAG: thioredoxin-like domain-containing protein [Planctomycetaceae bacterium]
MRFVLCPNVRLRAARLLLFAICFLSPFASGDESSDTGSDNKSATVEPATDADDSADDSTTVDPAPDAVVVPDGILEGGSGWLNTSKPLTMKELRGKIVLLDFWTYCCINCMHVLPDLKFLEEKYPNELVVIGVHSAKFDNEKDSDNIRNAILRYEIRHPVINDSDMAVWQKFGVRAWPTLALVDAEGRYIGSQGGEGHRELFDQVIGKLVAYHRAKGTLNEKPLAFDLEAGRVEDTPLRYPGKVLADETSDRLFISDSNHNRIVVTDLNGSLKHVIGTGEIGAANGAFEEAQFSRPQGMCLVESTLYVADTENHLLRSIDLDAMTVSTLAGTGKQGRVGAIDGSLALTALNSPWDVCDIGGTLFIAMAGPHQIWAHERGSDRIRIHAGSGRENVTNGPLLTSAFAQPSGLAVSPDGASFFVADSEGSAIRRVPVANDGLVTTLAGTSELPSGQSLFAFGDVDGVGDAARFQHPLGVGVLEGSLYVADSYNHRIRRVNLNSAEVTSWLGTGKPGSGLAPPQLDEPAGLSVAGGRLYIADTNNHRICVADPATAEMTVLSIDGLMPPAAVSEQKPEKANDGN